MKGIKTIHGYIFRELISPFLICFVFLTFIFLMTRILAITSMVINYHANLLSTITLIAYTLPRFMEFTIPMSVMIAVLLTFMRMSGENEILAIKATGISIMKLLPPVLIFCLAGAILTMGTTLYGVPWSKLSFKKKSMDIARSGIDMALEERRFNTQIKGIMIYVSQVDMNTRKLTDVLIEDRRTKNIQATAAAPTGQIIVSEDENLYTIRLSNGMIHQVNMDNNTSSTIYFGNYDINIDLHALTPNFSGEKKDIDEYSIQELFEELKKPARAEKGEILMLIHEKFSIPFACIFLGLVAFPLGIRSLSLRKSSGFGMGICIFLLYYFLLAAGWSAGESGTLPPLAAMWIPNFIMGIVGIFFLWCTMEEAPIVPPQIVDVFLDLSQKLHRTSAP